MAAAGNGVYRTKSDVVWAVSDDVTEPDNNGRGQTAGSGLAGGKEWWLTVGCGDNDVTQWPTSKPVCVRVDFGILTKDN